MKKKWYLGRLLAVGLLGGSLALFGCSSDGKDGAPGADGAQGPPGPAGEDATFSMKAAEAHQPDRAGSVFTAQVDQVVVNPGTVTVTFTVEDARYVDAPAGVNAEFTIAKWVESEGSWINLLQRSRGAETIIRGGNLREDDPTAKVSGTPVDGGMQYTYTFVSDNNSRWGNAGDAEWTPVPAGQPLDFTNSPLWRGASDLDASYYCEDGDNACVNYVQGIISQINQDAAWDPNGTYRVGVTGRDRDAEYVRFAAVADFTLANGEVVADSVGYPEPINQISQASCTSCHGERLTFPRNEVHGRQRPDVNVCFNCHNNYTFDRNASVAAADGWVNISMANIAHKIHSGIEGYTVDGYAYEEVGFPDWTLPGTSNCTSCHVGDVPAAGEGWNYAITAFSGDTGETACAACHTAGGYLFDLSVSGDHLNTTAAAGLDCVDCHGKNADTIHGVSARLEQLRAQREDYFFELISVENPVAGQAAQVTWQVLDANGTPYPLTADMVAGVRLQLGWGLADGEADDWINDPTDKGQPVREATHVVNGTTVTTTMNTLPGVALAGHRGFVAIQRAISVDGVNLYPTSVVQPIVLSAGVIDDFTSFAPRRNTVNASSVVSGRGGGCLDCHGTIQIHGGGWSADNNIQACVTCHSAGSDSDPSRTRHWVKKGDSFDMMYLMHKIHTSEEFKPDGTKLLYPNDMPGRCHACHVGYTDERDVNVDGPLNGGVSNCSLCHDGAVNPGRLGVVSDWNDNYAGPGTGGANTPNASLCYSCHQNFDEHNAARYHMTNLGGDLIGGRSIDDDAYEGCATCHGGFRP